MSGGDYRAPKEEEAQAENQAKVASDGPEEAPKQRHPVTNSPTNLLKRFHLRTLK